MAVEFITIVWRLSPYRAEKLLVQLAFADWANLDGEFYPTYKEIAEKARITKPGAVGIVQSMIDDGEIEIIQHGGNGRGSRNRYRFAEKYRAAVRELSQRWSAKRAERVNKDDPLLQKRVNEDDPLLQKRVIEDDSLRVKRDDSFSTKRVNEDDEKGKRETKHIRNNRHAPSCNNTVMLQQQQVAAPIEEIAAAANNQGLYSSEDHASRYTFEQVRTYCEAMKRHATNPGGLARKIWRSGEEDDAIAEWLEETRARNERRSSAAMPGPNDGFDDFSMDDHIDGLIAAGDLSHLQHELEGIEQRGGPQFEWERRVVAYLQQHAASGAA